MKPTTRRLGRGLGAFLDFGPSGEDGAAFVSGAITADATSILETSVASPGRPRGPVPAIARQPVPAPVPVAAPVAAAPAPVEDESLFIDEYIDDFVDVVVPIPAAAPEPVTAPAPVAAPAPAAPVVTRIAPEPQPIAADDNVFIDDVVAPLSFDVDLE